MSALPRADAFETGNFTTRSDGAQNLVDRALSHVAGKHNPSLLDLGCGSGDVAAGAAAAREDLTSVALDISAKNVEEARKTAERYGVDQRVRAICEDFLSWGDHGEYDVIVSDSVLHILSCADATLAERLATALKPGGVLIASLPIASAGNQLRILSRRAWRALPAGADALALALARRLHPDFSRAMLEDRIPYLRFIPQRMYGGKMKCALAQCGLEPVAVERWDSPSLLKLEHRLIVWRRPD
jgi:SAM-dependent methyltransferase